MIAILGASGYIGQAFQRTLQRRGLPYHALSRQQLDYHCYPELVEYLRSRRPRLLINAAGFTGSPNVDACETERAETLRGNALLPLTISHACQAANISWGHVSSGCIYSGAIVDDGLERRVERNLLAPAVRAIIAERPERIRGFTESDQPNFSFRQPPCSFYSGSKAMGEEALAGDDRVYVWRLRIPFNERDCPRNYLSKLLRYPKAYDNYNSISHLDDFVSACLGLWAQQAAFGIYNITNPGFVSTRRVVELIQKILKPNKSFEYWESDEQFYQFAALAPRSNCILDCSKLLDAGIQMRNVECALTAALDSYI